MKGPAKLISSLFSEQHHFCAVLGMSQKWKDLIVFLGAEEASCVGVFVALCAVPLGGQMCFPPNPPFQIPRSPTRGSVSRL